MSTNPFARTPQQQAGASKFNESAAPGQMRLPSRLSDDTSKPIPFGRLLSVELRKLYDTRAGKWLLASTVLISALLIFLGFLNRNSEGGTFGDYAAASIIGLRFILPVVGVLTVTSEWSQRTGLVTFALEPRRARVAVAKWVAVLLLTTLVVSLTLAMAALATMATSHPQGMKVWDFTAGDFVRYYLIWLVAASMGVAFGLVIQNTPMGVCAFLFLPILYSALTESSDFLRRFGDWTDPNSTSIRLVSDDSGNNAWMKFGTATLLWLVVPMIFGFVRLTKRELKSS